MEFIQCSTNEWNEVAMPIALLTLSLSVDQFACKHELPSFKYLEQGLGELQAIVGKIGVYMYWIKGPSDQTENCWMSVQARSFERNLHLAKKLFLDTFSINHDQIKYENDLPNSAEWSLIRVDDNNNEVEMFAFYRELDARSACQNFEKKGHKQMYFTRRIILPDKK